MLIEAGGLGFRVETGGPEGAPDVTFVHGLAASLEVWEEQARSLADRYRTLRYDLRSHGRSQAVDQACTPADLARDLVGILDRLGIEKVALVGHSAGGVIAMRTVIDFPERVTALCLVGTASECNDRGARFYQDSASAAREKGGEAGMRAMGVDPPAPPVPDGPGLAHLALAMGTLNREPLTERLGAVAVPTLIIVGERDFLGVGGSVILSRAIDGSELEIVPERSHSIFLEAPDLFAERLGRFLDRAHAA